MLIYQIYDTLLGKMLIAADERGIVHLYPAHRLNIENMEQGETPLLRLAAEKLEAYLGAKGGPTSKNRCGRPCAPFPTGKPAATPGWLRPSEGPRQSGRWEPLTGKIPFYWPSPATGLLGPTALWWAMPQGWTERKSCSNWKGPWSPPQTRRTFCRP